MHLNVWIDTDQYPVEVTQAYLNIGPQRTLEQAVNDLEKEYHAKMQHLYQVSKTLEQILIQFLQAGIQPAKGTRISCDFGDYQIDEINLKHYPNRIPTITVVVVDAI